MKSEKEVQDRLFFHKQGRGNAVNNEQYVVCDVRAKELEWVLGE